jgi:ferredoxin
MRSTSRAVILGMLAAVLAATISPLMQSKSNEPCGGCHGSYYEYLDILEGDPGNVLPSAIGDPQVLEVTVILKNECNAGSHNVMTSVSASLVSENGHFGVQNDPIALGSLGPGQTKPATWQITPLSAGPDTMIITASGRNSHNNCQFTDHYLPAPVITVNKSAPDIPPSIALSHPVPGLIATGGTDLRVEWNITDEDKAGCLVGIHYSTDGFSSTNDTLATGLPPEQPYTWPLPQLDSSSVTLKLTVIDPKGHYNETVMTGPFSIDSTLPSLSAFEPPDGSRNISDSAFIVARFSEPVAPASVQAAFSVQPNPGGLSWSWNAESTILTLGHSPFKPQTRYTCQFSAGVMDRSIPGNVGQNSTSWSFTTSTVVIPVPSISLSSPSEGGKYYWGEAIDVNWTASGGTGSLTINLSISGNDTQGPFEAVATGLSNNGSYSFPAPAFLSDSCLIEASVHDANGMGSVAISGDFSIAEPLRLVATFSTGNGTVRSNDSIQIRWNATGGFGTVIPSLLFQPDPNASRQMVVTRLPRSGSYCWTAPVLDAGQAGLFLKVTDGWGRSVENASGEFIISTGTVLPPPPPPPPPPKLNHPPVVMFDVKEQRVFVEGAATFDASASSDPDGDALYFLWDFGDGSTPMNTTTPVVVHVYSDKGDFIVQLTAGDGKTSTIQSMPVVVEDTRPALSGAGSDWALISLGMLVVIMGTVGTVYAGIKPETDAAPEETSFTDVPRQQAPLTIDDGKCLHCGACAKKCPRKAIAMVDGRPVIDGTACDGCEECVRKCVRGAISSNGQKPPGGG